MKFNYPNAMNKTTIPSNIPGGNTLRRVRRVCRNTAYMHTQVAQPSDTHLTHDSSYVPTGWCTPWAG